MQKKCLKRAARAGRMLALLCAVCVLGGLLTGCAKAASGRSAVSAGDLPVITVGCDDYPPFSYVDVDGNMTGIDVELAGAIAVFAELPSPHINSFSTTGIAYVI